MKKYVTFLTLAVCGMFALLLLEKRERMAG